MRYRRNPRKYILRILLREDGEVAEILITSYSLRDVIRALEKHERDENFLAAFLEAEDD